MGRYLTPANLRDFLTGYEVTPINYSDALLQTYISAAEGQVDAYCQLRFHLHSLHEVHNGNGSWTIMTREYPLFLVDKITVRYYPLTVIREFTETDIFLLMQKWVGKISIRPSFSLLGAFPPDYAHYYAFIFPRGENNIQVQIRVGYCQVGDNIGLQRVSDTGYNEVGIVETVGGTTFFRCSEGIGGVSAATIGGPLTGLAQTKMFKTDAGQAINIFTDDSASWTVVDNQTLSIPAASFTAAAMYRLIYIPEGVYGAAMRWAATQLLRSKGGRDDSLGSGGTQSVSIGQFNEDYGEAGRYGPQFKAWSEEAKQMLQGYRKGMVVVNR